MHKPASSIITHFVKIEQKLPNNVFSVNVQL